MEDKLYQFVNTYGVTTLQVTPGPANPIAGRAGIFKSAGPLSPFRTADQLIVRLNSGMVFNLGESPKQTYGASHKAPVTRMKTAEMIRGALLQATQYQDKWDKWKREGSDPSKQPTIGARLRPYSTRIERMTSIPRSASALSFTSSTCWLR
jgi:hypothetical protein